MFPAPFRINSTRDILKRCQIRLVLAARPSLAKFPNILNATRCIFMMLHVECLVCYFHARQLTQHPRKILVRFYSNEFRKEFGCNFIYNHRTPSAYLVLDEHGRWCTDPETRRIDTKLKFLEKEKSSMSTL